MFALFIPIIPLIYFDFHISISKPIYHWNLKDQTLLEFDAMKNEIWTSKREKSGSYLYAREAH